MTNYAFYYSSDKVWIFRDTDGYETVVPPNSCILYIKEGTITLRTTNGFLVFPHRVPVIEIEKSEEAGDFYTSVAEFLTATETFFNFK